MNIFAVIKNSLLRSKYHLKSNNLESIIWLVNLVPSGVGFSILGDKISAPYWILHLTLLSYVYGLGSIVYQMQTAQGVEDFIKSLVNISIMIFIYDNSYWFLMKRSLLKTVLEQVSRNDRLSMENRLLREKHDMLLSLIKKILFIFYGLNCLNATFIYLPHRTNVSNDYYGMKPCVGLDPLTVTPNRQICRTIIFTQELTIMAVVLNYQALLLFLIAHTAVMYEMLSAEILTFDEYEDCPESHAIVKDRLPRLISRHILTLDIIKNLKSLYSKSIGINFGSNAVIIGLCFFLPLDDWITFMPIFIFCFLVFFLYCFLCQKLINASEKFESAVYCCGWEKFNLMEKKTIYLMLMVAQKPVILLAGDIIPVNIYTFATTLQFIYKFITVVKL